MRGKRYSEEFKIEAVKQVNERGYKPKEGAERSGVTPKSIHDWQKKYGHNRPERSMIVCQQEELSKPEARCWISSYSA